MSTMNLMVCGFVGLFTGALLIAAMHLLSGRAARPALPPGQHTEEQADYDPFVHGSRSEKRGAPRRAGNPVSIKYVPAGRQGVPASGLVRDRSSGGLCLIVPDAFNPGAQIRLLPASAPETTPWVEVEVKTCRQVSGGYELGCQFVRQPPWSVQVLFG